MRETNPSKHRGRVEPEAPTHPGEGAQAPPPVSEFDGHYPSDQHLRAYRAIDAGIPVTLEPQYVVVLAPKAVDHHHAVVSDERPYLTATGARAGGNEHSSATRDGLAHR
jgi:hypothetical protein